MSKSKKNFLVLSILIFTFFFFSLLDAVPGFKNYSEYDRLATKAASEGSVRVIVELNVPGIKELTAAANYFCSPAPEEKSKWAGGPASMALRDGIMDVVQFVLLQIRGKEYEVNHIYKSIPYLALSASAEVIAVLRDTSWTLAIKEDLPHQLIDPINEDASSKGDGQKPALVEAYPQLLNNTVNIIHASNAWAMGYTGAGWYVAILDTGIRETHEFFAGKTVVEACFALGRDGVAGAGDCPNGLDSMIGDGAAVHYPSTYDGYDHGTHVSGIATGNNGSLFGVAKDANIIAVKVFSMFRRADGCPTARCVMSWDSDQVAGLDYVYSIRGDYSIAAVNMSLGGGQYASPCDTDPQKAAIDNLRAVGIATAIATGNDGYCNSIGSPGCISTSVAVGSSTDTDLESSFNNWHPTMQKLFAPGSAINSSTGASDTSYASWNGTSMATPHVTGAWAILKHALSTVSVTDALAALQATGVPITSVCDDYTVAIPRINLDDAIWFLRPASITVTSPNGGESWMVNTIHDITWTSAGAAPVGNVDIDYSINNGMDWISIAGNTANDGVHEWAIPDTPSANCLVRVREIDGSPTDQSNAVFSIIAYVAETVSAPTTLEGPQWGFDGIENTYTFGGSSSSWGDPVQYLIDWGDGEGSGSLANRMKTDSGWLPVGTISASHAWTATGEYSEYVVQVKARCSVHLVESDWSDPITVRIYLEPTWAAIMRFAACEAESFPTVEWHTGTEAGTVGFYLWRQDKETKEYELANPYFLPALPNAPQGGFYRLADPGAQYGEPMTYKLEEVDAQGRRMMYGPFTVTFGAHDGSNDLPVTMGKEDSVDIDGYQRFRREPSTYEQERLRARQLAARESAIAHSVSKVKERARITVKGKGLFYMSSAQVADSLGFAEVKAASLISGYRLSLTGMGKEIAWLADANGAGIFFHNQGLETEYSDKNVYFLEQGSGLAMETMGNGNAGPAPDGQTYRDTLMAVENHYFLPSMEKNTLADSWFWDYVVAGSRSRTFTIIVPGLATTGQATLRVVFRGATDTAADNDHHAVVTLNGSEIGSASWDGGKDQALEVSFSASKLVEGANTIVVSGMLDMGAPYSIFYVDGFELGYPRYYKAENNTLLCRGDGNSVITVSGITEPEVVVLDVSKPIKPKQVIGVAPDLGGRVTFVPRDPEKEFLVSGLNAALRPLSVVGDRPARLKNVENSAEYVVIAPEEFEQAAEELADYRKGKGLKAMVVTLEDIYDSFNYGMPSPYAIHEFLAYAYGKWSGKKLKYAVLAGKGTYDYKDYQGHGDNLVPAVLAKSEYGYYAADRVFGDVVGKNLVPEIAIGRLPAVTAAELRAMIDKVKAYENGQGDWASKAIFIADNGNDFFAGSDGLAALATGFEAEKVYLDGSAADERERIATMWSAGAGLVNYCGHGGMMQLAEEELLDVDGARELRNGDKLPLLVALTCVAGRFEVPGYTSLGEALALSGEGGMAGGLVPSGAGMHADSMRLGEGFYRAALSGKGLSAGQALVKAMKEYVQNGGSKELLNIYNWLGDPALKFK